MCPPPPPFPENVEQCLEIFCVVTIWGVAVLLDLVGRSQGFCQKAYKAKDSPTTKNYSANMAAVPSLRNHAQEPN